MKFQNKEENSSFEKTVRREREGERKKLNWRAETDRQTNEFFTKKNFFEEVSFAIIIQ